MAEIKIEDLLPEQKTQVRDGIGAVENTNAAVNAVLDDNPSATRTAIGAAGTGLSSVNYAARSHINYNVPFLALRNALQSKISTDIVVFGDSTGVGTEVPTVASARWAYKLAQAITAAYPNTGVEYWQLSNDANKVWSKTTLRESTGLSGLYTYPAVISPWESGQSYAAGTYVTTYVAPNTFKWFCRKSHTSSAENQPSQTSTPEYWTGLSNQPQYQLSLQACPLFYGNGDGTTTSTEPFEIELEFTYHAGGAGAPTMFATGFTAGSKDTIRLDRNSSDAGFTMYIRPTAGANYVQFGSSTALPFSNGDRVRLRFQIIPNNGTNCTWKYLYSKFDSGTWSAWATHYSGSTTPRTWCTAQGPLLVTALISSSSSPCILHNVTVRRSTNNGTNFDVTELDASIDNYSGYGSGGLAYFGMPNVRIWNASWSGTEIKHFADLANIPLYAGGTTNFSWELNIPSPSNAQLVFVNFGHNGHMLPPDNDNATVLRRLVARIRARFPRASICVMSQNPGINGYIYGTPVNTHLNYSHFEPQKQMKKAYEAQACAEDGHAFIDINRVFVDSGLKNSYSDDGLHPNSAGSALWANTLYKAITGTLDQ